MTPRSLFDRLFDALASLRLAVVVMSTLGLTCLFATIYESKHGTPAVQRDIYKTRWFAGILVLLGVNIFCAMMKRYPWKEHHMGFVMAHIGILTLLAGSLISLHFGIDGNMALFEGETTDRVTLLEKSLAGDDARPRARRLPGRLREAPAAPRPRAPIRAARRAA